MRRAIAISIVLGVFARRAEATPYETFVDIDDQAALEDLLAAGDLTQDTFDELLDLLQSGVDLNRADRAQLYALPNLTYQDVDAIIAYRDTQKGGIKDPAALVAAGVISEDKLLAIAAFITVSGPDSKLGVKGFLRAQTRWSLRDSGVPPFALRGRFTVQRKVTAGFAAVLTRLQVGDPVYDPNRNALTADRPGLRAHLPKVYLKYDDDEGTLIAGSFRAGFGQRLVFDNTNKYTPNGLYADDQLFFSTDLVTKCKQSAGELPVSPCSGPEGDVRVTPDWRWRNSLLGVGAGFKRLALGTGYLQGYVWASAANRSIYQYELYDRGKCASPYDDNNASCSAPTVFVTPDGNNPLVPTPRTSFETLPNVFQERVVGFNATYYADRRNSIGVTAYAANEVNLVSGIDLDTQEWSRIPMGHSFGAAGANFAVGRKGLDVFGEAAHSFDKLLDGPGPQAGGGGPAAILRVTATRRGEELETVLRYYSTDFVNPFGRPIAQPDEFDGQRARDELGVRLRYFRTVKKRWTVRALLDLWVPPSSFSPDSVLGRAQPKLDSYVRAEVQTTDQIRVGAWFRYQDKDLRVGGHDQCYEVTTETNENGEPIPCAGRQMTTIGRVRYQPDRKSSFELMIQHQLLDDPSQSKTSFRHDLSGWLIARYAPTRKLRSRARLRFLDEAIEDNSYLERSVSALVDTAYVLRSRDILRVRVDGKLYLDDRASTARRDPNPEFQLWLSYEARL
ncbi:MAG: helix-hairpin-helix domain-containing protein [Deltaproteobacteria bacterium]|nr:helix-hairpin-helix domain-containing protein [Deltaproteobacteria bacterium]MCW5805633.1 helix-hairpin-helix domain-containing protein [Deltaproteobacteria bacterium]